MAEGRAAMFAELAEVDRLLDEIAEHRAFAFEHRNYTRDAMLAREQNTLRAYRLDLVKRLGGDPTL